MSLGSNSRPPRVIRPDGRGIYRPRLIRVTDWTSATVTNELRQAYGRRGVVVLGTHDIQRYWHEIAEIHNVSEDEPPTRDWWTQEWSQHTLQWPRCQMYWRRDRYAGRACLVFSLIRS